MNNGLFTVCLGSGPVILCVDAVRRSTEGAEVFWTSELFPLCQKQHRRIEPYFLLSHGVPRVGRRVLSGIIFILRNGVRWRHAPTAYGPDKTLQPVRPMGIGWACPTTSSGLWPAAIASMTGL